MKVRDKSLNADVDVYERACLIKPCYRVRRDPGVFAQGRGYRARPGGNGGYECGTRALRGCPE
jgi:hypothetical protein